MNVKKIAVLVETINSHSGSRAPIEIAKGLKNLGIKVTIIGFSNNLDLSLKKDLLKSGININTFPKFASFIKSRLLPDFRIVKILKRGNFDLAIAAVFLPSVAAAKLANLPILKIYMGTQFNAYLEKFNPDEKINLKDKFFNTFVNVVIYTFELISLTLANHIVAISNYCAQEIKRLYFKNVDDTIYLGGNHLKTATILSPDKSSRTINLLAVSRITPYKNFHLLITAVSNLKVKKRVNLTILGSSTNPKYLSYLSKIKRSNIKIIEDPSDYKLTKSYQDCDFILSADRYLFFGFPIAEAAFFQKSAISLDFAAAREVIKNNKTGFVVKSPKEMTQAIEKLINDPQLLKNLGENAQKRAQDLFTWQKIAKKYLERLEKL